MMDRVEQRFDLKPKRLIGDTVYSVEMLGWVVDEKAIDRMCWYGTRPSAATARSRDPTSSGAKKTTRIAALVASHSCHDADTSPRCAPGPGPIPSFIALRSTIAKVVR